MTPVEQIIEHARQASHRILPSGDKGWRHTSIYDVVLAHGRVFDPEPLPANVYPAFPGHACRAAAILADQHALAYVEGLALLPDMHTVIEHAWCTAFSGHVVDPGLGGDVAAAYVGVAFTADFRRTILARSGGTRPILISDAAGNSTPNLDILEYGLAAAATLAIGKPLGVQHALRSCLQRFAGAATPATHARGVAGPVADDRVCARPGALRAHASDAAALPDAPLKTLPNGVPHRGGLASAA